MLRVYNLLPAGKPDLFQALHQLFGPTLTSAFKESLQDTVDQSDNWSMEIMRRTHRLEEIYQAFSSHLGHLQDLASLVVEKAQRFEQLVAQALQQIAPGEICVEPPTGGDLLLERNQSRYIFELKSLIGPCTTAPLEQLKRYVYSLSVKATPILIVNAHRKIPC
jgi:hypothetical protein